MYFKINNGTKLNLFPTTCQTILVEVEVYVCEYVMTDNPEVICQSVLFCTGGKVRKKSKSDRKLVRLMEELKKSQNIYLLTYTTQYRKFHFLPTAYTVNTLVNV